MAIQLMRRARHPLYRATNDPHPELLIQRGYAINDHDTEECLKAKTGTYSASVPSRTAPPQQCQSALVERHRQSVAHFSVGARLESRLFIGLTGGLQDAGDRLCDQPERWDVPPSP